MKKHWGFNSKTIDKKVRPQDDFYSYANGTWLKKTKIPPEEAKWGSFYVLRYETEQQLKKLIDSLLKKKNYTKGSPQQLVVDYYRSAMDMPRRNKLGFSPVLPWLEQLNTIKNTESLVKYIGELHRLGISSFWGAGIEQDFKNSSAWRLYIAQGGLGLPDRDYYLQDTAEYVRVREAYKKHMRALLKLAGKSKADIERIATVAFAIETRLARVSMKREELRDPEKIYHKKTASGFARSVPRLYWSVYAKKIGTASLRELIVMQPAFFAEINKIFGDTPLEELRAYMEWHIISGFSGFLGEAFLKENFKWAQALTGQKKMRSLWRRALGAVNGGVGEALGTLYIDAYFDQRSKKAMDELVSDLFVVFKERLEALEWMSPATKKKALAKLKLMDRKIAYPKKYEKYKGLVLKADDYVGNALRAEEWHHTKEMRKLKKPVDRTEWITTPQVVNAFYNPLLNDINFPAAILQWPFFSADSDAAVNYAGIGTVIGHEITHGFDDEGSKFNGQGNLKSWWHKTDRTKFMNKAQLLVDQFNSYEAAPGVNTNGKLTLGENIADLGGLCIGFDAYQRYLAKHGRNTIDGFTPEERFFLGFAQMERTIAREQYRAMQALTDPHAEASQRINGPLANFDPFYDTFNIKKSDKLYRSPEKRAKIW
ncbi:MAG TPA: M13 family metallopeptidase [Candidatus Paceibacterota bacterium]|nr:M13 family metallopeptidase [Candidatus Paceibacterota bacterium]